MTTTTERSVTKVYRAYDGMLFAERTVDNDGLVWERRNLIDGWGDWYCVGFLGAET